MAANNNNFLRILYAGSQNNADLLYLTGFSAGDPFLYLEGCEDKYVIVSGMEVERARQQCKPGVQVFSTDEMLTRFAIPERDTEIINKIILGFAREKQAAILLLPEEFPLKRAMDLRQMLDAAFPGQGKLETVEEFCPERKVKTPQEIECIRKAERLAESGLEAALTILRAASIRLDDTLAYQGETVTSEMLKGAINGEIARRGGVSLDVIASSGKQSACPHVTGTGPVYANTPIVLDIFPRDLATGYFGDLTRTVVKGKATEIVKKAFQTVYDVQRKAMDQIRPGVTGESIQLLAEDLFRKAGYETNFEAKVPYGFIHGFGHGVGLEIHEAPSVSHRGTTPLVAGNVVSAEPGLYYPEWGGIRIEDVVAVTADGIDDLTVAPVQLEIE